MLNPKNSGLFFDLTDSSLMVARTSGTQTPFVLQSLTEIPLSDGDGVQENIAEIADLRKGQYAQGNCGVYPSRRFVNRITVEQANKLKDPVFLAEHLREKHKVELKRARFHGLTKEGEVFDIQKSPVKDFLICGAPDDELDEEQARLVECGIYPVRMELGSLATMAALMHYSRVTNQDAPILMVEIGAERSHVFIFDKSDLIISRPIPHGIKGMLPIVQSELGLKDEESARKLFFSDTFDFTEMAPALLKNLLKELQASSGYYEVQTGQTIGHIFLGNIPRNLAWIRTTLARSLAVEPLKIDYNNWLQALGGSPGDNVDVSSLDQRWCGLFGLIGDFSFRGSAPAPETVTAPQPQDASS